MTDQILCHSEQLARSIVRVLRASPFLYKQTEKDKIDMNIKTKLAGVNFKPAKDNMQELEEGMVLAVVHEPDNKFDSNAMSVRNGEKHVGYIPSKGGLNRLFLGTTTCTVTNVMRKAGKKTDKDFEEGGFSNDTSVPVVAVEIEADLVEIDTPAALSTEKPKKEPTHLKCKKVKSFNEEGVIVNFYPRPYYGFWYNGKRLHGVTRKIDTMYEEFDADMIACRCAQPWGMKPDDIKDMWSRNGDIANQFGKSIHSGMENFETYGDRGLPKMQVLRDIITSCPLTPCDEVFTEVFLTDIVNETCGFVDRLARAGDVYQVQDYKINIDAEKSSKQKHENLLFPSLPYTKLSHYVCQESYYSELLEMAFKVSGTVVSYIWDGSWHVKEVGRIHSIVSAIESAIDKSKRTMT